MLAQALKARQQPRTQLTGQGLLDTAAIESIRQKLGPKTPVLTGLAFGHCPDKLTLPVGRYASLSATSDAFILQANCA
jgi:muramoyltetrapeptide carboxypeptidase LdcA involved in peptidoglycan recycling